MENILQGPPGQKGDQGATEIIDYNGNIHEALQVCKPNNARMAQTDLAKSSLTSMYFFSV